MKAGKYILVIGTFLSSLAIAQGKKTSQTAIHFLDTDWRNALALAKQSHKPVFVDAYASWCVPCQQMRQTTFKNRHIADYFNAHYINVTIDVEKNAGKLFADQYQVATYPTLLFINEDGRVIKRMEGFIDAKDLISASSALN